MAMHNTIYPGTATKFQGRPISPPPFANHLVKPLEYPGHAQPQTPIGGNLLNHHRKQYGQQQQQQQLGQLPIHQHQQQKQQQQQLIHQQQHQPSFSMSMHHPAKGLKSRSNSATGHHVSGSNTMNAMGLALAMKDDNLDHQCSDLIYPDEMDSIEFCLPPPPAPSNGHSMGHGVSNEMLLGHGQNGFCSGESFNERRRRTHSRRSNNKIEIEQQVKWSRKNIAATMERFEPTQHHSSSSTSSLEYGFGANAITPSSTPSHHSQQQISPAPTHAYQGAATASAPYNHMYSYAYYEPGMVKCHTNVPPRDDINAILPAPSTSGAAGGPPPKSPTRNSIRALLAKSFRSKSQNGQSTSSSPNADNRHTYTTRYGTTENLYEEVNDQKMRKVLSDNRITTTNVKDELRRVQHNHFRVLDQLNLSLEALIMPQTPPDTAPNEQEEDEDDGPSTSAAAAAAVVATAAASSGTSLITRTSSQRPRRGGLLGGASSSSSTVSSTQQHTLSHASLENLSSTLNSIELKEHPHSACINPEFDEGDLDSGFSGSGSSSGASYNESLRYYKTGPANIHHLHPQHHLSQQQQQQHLQHHMQMQTTALPHNVRSCRSSTASGTSTSKSSVASYEDQGIGGIMTPLGLCATAVTSPVSDGAITSTSPFNYSHPQHYMGGGETQRSSMRSMSASTTGTKPKKSFWNLKP